MPIVRYLTAAVTLGLCLTQLPFAYGLLAAIALLALERGDPEQAALLDVLLRRRHPRIGARRTRPHHWVAAT